MANPGHHVRPEPEQLSRCAMAPLETTVPDDAKVTSMAKTELSTSSSEGLDVLVPACDSAEGELEQGSTSAEVASSSPARSISGSEKERTPTPPLKANGLRIKVGARRNSGPILPPATDSDALVNFEPKIPAQVLPPNPEDGCELELPRSKEFWSGSEEHARVPATQVFFVTEGPEVPRTLGATLDDSIMALPSTSFQPPLPTDAPAPPACPPPPPPPPPPLPPCEPTVDSRSESLLAPARALMTEQSHSARDAQSLATSSLHSAPNLSHLPSSQCLQPTSADPLPQGATSDKVSNKTSHAGEKPKLPTEASPSGGRPAKGATPTKEKLPTAPSPSPAVRSPLDVMASSPQLPSRYKIPKTPKAPAEARSGSAGKNEARSASASRVDGALVKQGREGRRKPERSQRCESSEALRQGQNRNLMSQESVRSTVQDSRDQQTRHSSREPREQGPRRFSVQESRRLLPSQGSSQQGPSREVTSQDTVDMRSENRSRQVADKDDKLRLKRPRESRSSSPNPHQERPSVICSAPLVAAPSSTARSASAARVPQERSASAAREPPQDNMDAELSSLSALLHSQVPSSRASSFSETRRHASILAEEDLGLFSPPSSPEAPASEESKGKNVCPKIGETSRNSISSSLNTLRGASGSSAN